MLNTGEGDFLLLVPVVVCLAMMLTLLLIGTSASPARQPATSPSCPSVSQPC